MTTLSEQDNDEEILKYIIFSKRNIKYIFYSVNDDSSDFSTNSNIIGKNKK